MLMCVVVLCTSCASSKKVVYLQDVVPLKQQDIEQKYEVYVHNDDLLAIMVACGSLPPQAFFVERAA